MFSSQKTATAAAFVGGLAAIFAGAGHAYAEGKSDDCHSAAQSGVVCIQKSETHIDKDGTQVVKQEQDCSTVGRPHVAVHQDQLLETQSAKGGPVVECSNTTKLPRGFKKPHIKL